MLKIYSVIISILFIAVLLKGKIRKIAYAKPVISTTDYAYDASYWKQKNSLFENLACKDKIVFIGNSITDNCEWAELFQRNDIVNRAIGGERAIGVLMRIESILKYQPKAIFMMIGINDICQFRAEEEYTDHIKLILLKTVEAKIPVYFQSVLFVSKKYKDYAKINDRVERLNTELADFCCKNNIPFIDLNIHLSKNHLLEDQFTNDGIHPLYGGYEVVRDKLLPFINKL